MADGGRWDRLVGMNAMQTNESGWTSLIIHGVSLTTALVRAAGVLVFAGGVALGWLVIRANFNAMPYRHDAALMALAVAGMMAGIALETAYHALRRREQE